MVSSEHGKKAITEYQIISESERITSESENTFNESNRIDESERSINESRKYTRIIFYPLTGRTHQLRVHAAHPEGLGCPILGDELYGKKADTAKYFVMRNLMSIVRFFLKISNYPYIHFKKNLVHGLIIFFY